VPTAPAALSPPAAQPLHVHDEFSLAALLDLFEDDREPARPVPECPAPRPGGPATLAGRAGRAGRRLVEWGAACRRRAAEWGMGPGGSRRAW
jgi:hypothetical protein